MGVRVGVGIIVVVRARFRIRVGSSTRVSIRMVHRAMDRDLGRHVLSPRSE